MSINPKSPELEKAEVLINKMVQVDSNSLFEADFGVKLDVLERTIELIRIHRKQMKHSLDIETYTQGDLFVDNATIHFCPPKKYEDPGVGIPSSYYQPKLLLFLLIYHREKYKVIEIIEMFIEKIWDDLDTLDFKKTDTGVIRCYTNIRFAAHTLRDFGLLRFTQREAYKTWELSLLGFLVASIVLGQDWCQWNRDKMHVSQGHFLQDGITKAIKQVKDYRNFVNWLGHICEPDTKVFKTFEGMLKEAYALLSKYQTVLSKENITKKERLEHSSELVHQLERLADIDKFYEEFSKCINVNRLLNTI